MAAQLRQRRLTILAIGPLTDVACLVLDYPREAAKIAEVVAIMGRRPGEEFAIGGKTGVTDFNYVMDERAAHVLRDSAVLITLRTFDLTKSAVVPHAAVEPLRQRTSPAAKFFQAVQTWLDFRSPSSLKTTSIPGTRTRSIYHAVNPAAFVCAGAEPKIVLCAGDPYHNAFPSHGRPEALARQGGLATLAGSCRKAAASQGLHRLREPRCQGELPRFDLHLPALEPGSAPPLSRGRRCAAGASANRPPGWAPGAPIL
jgi:hypothetical protein